MSPTAKLAYFAGGLPVAAAAVGALGAIRLTHQFPAATASPGLLVPFLLPVLALSLEAGALIALGAALLCVLARAAGSPPASSSVGRARVTVVLPALAAGVLALSQLIPRGTEHPGAFANQLVESARSSCGASGKVPVPLLGLSVRCDRPQRIEGPMPGARKAQLAMDSLSFSDDLRRVEISALELTVPSTPRVRLRADRARVSGLAPWARSPRLSALGRLALLTALGSSLWLAACLFVRPRPAAPSERRSSSPPPSPPPLTRARVWRLAAYLLFALPGVGLAAVVISLDQAQAPPAQYAAAGALGAAGMALVAWLLPRAPQIAGSFRIF